MGANRIIGDSTKKVALLLRPSFIEVEHYCVSTFISVRYIVHERRINRIAAVRTRRVVEVYHVERGNCGIALTVVQQVVVDNGR